MSGKKLIVATGKLSEFGWRKNFFRAHTVAGRRLKDRLISIVAATVELFEFPAGKISAGSYTELKASKTPETCWGPTRAEATQTKRCDK
jgi:hypothetical protein